MSDPQPDRLKPRPPRAEPLQPDQPASGDDQVKAEADRTAGGDATAAQEQRQSETAKQKAQTDTALENVRNGYS